MILTPLPTANRPGLSALSYRVGTFSAFYETMLGRLSSEDFPALAALAARTPDDPAIALLDAWSAVLDVLTFYQERIINEGCLRTAVERASILQMARLTGYTPNPGVAASVFLAYTLDKNRSVTIAAGSRVQSAAAQDTLPQSFETSSDLNASDVYNNLGIRRTQPSLLETGAGVIFVDSTANNLRSNDVILLVSNGVPTMRRIAVIELQPQQTQTKITLQPLPPPVAPGFAPVMTTTSSAPPLASTSSSSPGNISIPPVNSGTFSHLIALLEPLLKQPAAHPPNSEELVRSVATSFTPTSDTAPSLLKALYPTVGPQLDAAFRNAPVSAQPATEVYVLRAKAGPFGSNAPMRFVAPSVQTGGAGEYKEWDFQRAVSSGSEAFQLDAQIAPQFFTQVSATLNFTITLGQKTLAQTNVIVNQNTPTTVNFPDADETVVLSVARSPEANPSAIVTFAFQKRAASVSISSPEFAFSAAGLTLLSTRVVAITQVLHSIVSGVIASSGTTQATETPNILSLDASYDQIQPGTWVVLDGAKNLITKADKVAVASRADYGIVGRVTQLTLDKPWIDLSQDTFAAIRNTAVYAQAEPLSLREETITAPVSGQQLELDNLYTGLESGRWLIVQGERVDLPGVTSAELVMLASVDQDVRKTNGIPDPGEQVHSFLNLTNPLSYQYKRDTVTINANVAHATHGESRSEVLGSGDASQALQTFALHQKPLTYVSAPTATGNQSTLSLRVNNVLWAEAPNLLAMGPADRKYLTMTDDSGATSIVFGDGVHGLRPPTGVENIKADYRSGIGVTGNVGAGAITLLATRPLGVRSVVNPLASSGGADPETRDQARQNVPVGLSALSRLVSVQDYQDFSRSFAGVAKASAALMQAQTPLVYVTVAGANGFPVDPNSDLFRNLTAALLALGDPNFPIQVASFELLLIFISANVAVLPDYQWETVQPAVRAVVLDQLAFANRDLAQDVLASEIIAAIQSVEGVEYVDLQILATVPRNFTAEDLKNFASLTTVPDRIVVNDVRTSSNGGILPAQLAFLSPDITDLLILNPIKQ